MSTFVLAYVRAHPDGVRTRRRAQVARLHAGGAATCCRHRAQSQAPAAQAPGQVFTPHAF